MTTDAVTAEALKSLADVRLPYQDAVRHVPRQPGLYAFYGDDRAWFDLELSRAYHGQPLYVGKAERSLNGRDVGTHFAAGKTGSSTVRRSLAALLVVELNLVAVPRNVAEPDKSANFALDTASEARLREWMQQRLSLAIWSKSENTVLNEIESAVLRRLRPPLNLNKVGEPRLRLRQARKRVADAARDWKPSGYRGQGPTM